MNWFRSNIQHGSRLALLALALQFGLSFGHYHAGAAPDAVEQSAQLPAPHDESDQHPGEACAICAVIALAGSVLSAPQPSLLPPPATGRLFLTTDADFAHLAPVGGAFQPRAPPAS